MTTPPDILLPRRGRPALRWSRFGYRIFCFVFCVSGFVFAFACSTPQQRYKTLSFFFDGVPNPNARKIVPTTEASTNPAVIAASIVSRHQPYLDHKCALCHESATGQMLEPSEAYNKCTACHTTVTTKLPLMHGPVARGQCQWCHTGHESVYPALLKDDPIKVCTQCHDAQLLGPIPVQHTDGVTSCLECHFGHGGSARYFLKPKVIPQWPASRPATQPATAPGAPIEKPKTKTQNPAGAP